MGLEPTTPHRLLRGAAGASAPTTRPPTPMSVPLLLIVNIGVLQRHMNVVFFLSEKLNIVSDPFMGRKPGNNNCLELSFAYRSRAGVIFFFGNAMAAPPIFTSFVTLIPNLT